MTDQHATRPELDVELIKHWTSLQLAQAKQADYRDDPSFQVSYSAWSPTGVDPFSTEAHDYDDPQTAHIDPDSIEVKGISHVGGIDIGYDTVDPDVAMVVFVILTYPELELKHTFKEEVRPSQPYITSFLSMRELDHVSAIYDHAIAQIPKEDVPQVVFIDGFGRWHERQAGLATALGVEKGITTIGVGKEYQPLRPDLDEFAYLDEWPTPLPTWPEGSDTHFRNKQKLFRQIARDRLHQRGDLLGVPLYRNGPLVGAAVKTAPGKKNNATPAYISPGNKTSLGFSVALTMSCCIRKGVKQPEPIVLADRIGRDELRKRRES